MSRTRRLTAQYPKREAILADLKKQDLSNLLFIRTRRNFDLNEEVLVRVEFTADNRSFQVRGRVVKIRRHSSAGNRLAAGVELLFNPSQSRTLQMIMDHAGGKEVAFVDRKTRRVPASIEIAYRSGASFIYQFTEDLSEGGTFIRTDSMYPVGTLIDCKLKPPGKLLALRLRGRVAWIEESSTPTGMGIEFEFKNERQRQKVRDLVAKLAKQQSDEVARQLSTLKEKRSDPPPEK